MAGADYKSCDVCGGKAFYDANLSYSDGMDEWSKDRPPYRVAGQQQYSTPETNQKHGSRLGYVGDWAVICTECAKTHTVVIQKNPAGGV